MLGNALFTTMAVTAAGLFATQHAQATQDFSFLIDPADWEEFQNVTAGDLLNVSFTDTADLFNLTLADLVSIDFDFANAPTAPLTVADFGGFGDIVADVFSYDGTNLAATFIGSPATDGVFGTDVASGDYSQFWNGQGQLAVSAASGAGAYVSNVSQTTILTAAAQVPSGGGTALMLGLGLLGIALGKSNRR